MAAATTLEGAVYSRLGADPCLRELVELYVMEMPDRIAALEGAFSKGDLESLRRAAHQMKGAAGSYGFDPLTVVAAVLESSVRDNESIAEIQQTLQALVQLCHQVRAGTPQ